MKELLDKSPMKPVVFEQEFFPEDVLVNENLPFTVERSEEDPKYSLWKVLRLKKCLAIQIWILRRDLPSSRNS